MNYYLSLGKNYTECVLAIKEEKKINCLEVINNMASQLHITLRFTVPLT